MEYNRESAIKFIHLFRSSNINRRRWVSHIHTSPALSQELSWASLLHVYRYNFY